jgi:hypothetical protein
MLPVEPQWGAAGCQHLQARSTLMRLLSSLATFAVRYVLLCTSPVAVSFP